jgi:hypothetical protein
MWGKSRVHVRCAFHGRPQPQDAQNISSRDARARTLGTVNCLGGGWHDAHPEIRQDIAREVIGQSLARRTGLLFDDDFGVVAVGLGGLPDQLFDLMRR